MPDSIIFDDLFNIGGTDDLFDLEGGGNLFGDTNDSIWTNINNLTSAQVYTDLVDASAVTSDGEADTLVAGLTPNDTDGLDAFDFSGLSVITYRLDTAPDPDEWGYVQSVPCTMISDTHAIAADHNVPQEGGGKCWFRTPAGAAVTGTVAEVTSLTSVGYPYPPKLVRFSANPDATLKRYPICTDASLITHAAVTGHTWALQQDQSILIRPITGLSTYYWSHDRLTAGSGRPFLVPTTNGHLIIASVLTQEYACPRVSLAAHIAEIESILDGYGETLAQLAIPAYAPGEEPSTDRGVYAKINVGINVYVMPGIRGRS